jgi:hypothetical protein
MVQRLYQEGLIYRKTARARIEDHIEHLLSVSDPNDGYRDRRRVCTGWRQEPVKRGRMTHGFFRPVRIRPTRPDHNRAAASGRKCGRSREACLYLPRSGNPGRSRDGCRQRAFSRAGIWDWLSRCREKIPEPVRPLPRSHPAAGSGGWKIKMVSVCRRSSIRVRRALLSARLIRRFLRRVENDV